MTGLIGPAWKHSKVWSGRVLTGRGLHHDPSPAVACARIRYTVSETTTTRVVVLIGYRNFPRTHVCVCVWVIGVAGGDGGGETPGPVPNPEAKPSSADGTAPARVWESKTPPAHTQHERPPHKRGSFVFGQALMKSVI